MRWLGPGAALLATPLLMIVYVAHDRVATPGAVAVCCGLTGMALWRGFRLVREREESRRELAGEQRFRSLSSMPPMRW